MMSMRKLKTTVSEMNLIMAGRIIAGGGGKRLIWRSVTGNNNNNGTKLLNNNTTTTNTTPNKTATFTLNTTTINAATTASTTTNFQTRAYISTSTGPKFYRDIFTTTAVSNTNKQSKQMNNSRSISSSSSSSSTNTNSTELHSKLGKSEAPLKNSGSSSICTTTSKPDQNTSRKPTPPKRSVFISQSSDVFANLAFEDWLYKNWSFDRRNVLLLWRNAPCVVIGRHQNPQVEANLPYLESAGVPVARRGSGGGAVYHDHGNLNCTFFTTRERYDRHSNLELICRALNQDFGIQAHPNKRNDIVVEHDHKVSGSAAKLGRTSAYHHCTLLVSTDRQQLKLSLNGDKSINSKATASVPAHVMNLCDLQPGLTVERVLTSVGRSFLGQDHTLANGFTLVNPSDEWFPGLGELEAALRSSRWLEGLTPRCTITRRVPIPRSLLPHASHTSSLAIAVQAYHGLVEEVRMEDEEEKEGGGLERGGQEEGLSEKRRRDEEREGFADVLQDIGASLKGTPYTQETFNIIAARLRYTPTQHHINNNNDNNNNNNSDIQQYYPPSTSSSSSSSSSSTSSSSSSSSSYQHQHLPSRSAM